MHKRSAAREVSHNLKQSTPTDAGQQAPMLSGVKRTNYLPFLFKEALMLPQTVRRDMDTVEFSIPTEDLLRRLFGRSMLYIHGQRSEKTWKKLQRKIHFFLKKAVENNLQSDGFHKTRINRFLCNIEETCNSKENGDIEIILSLTAMVLELLGGLPDYSERRALNRSDDYFLSALRSLRYCQTPHQKMRTIIEAARYRPYCDYHKSEDLYEEYVTRYNGNSKGFLDWYKKQYPAAYAEIF